MRTANDSPVVPASISSSQPGWRSRPLLATALAAAALLIACEKKPAAEPTTAPAADPAPTAAVKPDFKSATCQDWSSLDPSSLAPLPTGEHVATLDSAWTTLLTKHYDPTLGCKDWPAVRTWYGEQVAAAADQDAAYTLMNGMLGELEQSHLALVPPGVRTQGEPRTGAKATTGMIPIDVRLLGETAVIVDAKRYGLDSGLPAGATVVSIDDHDVAPTLERISAHTHNDVEKAFTLRRAVGSWLACAPGSTKDVTVMPAGADAPKTIAAKCQEPKLETTTFGNLTQPTVVSHRMIDGTKVGYVAFNIWLVPMMQKINEGITQMRKDGMTSLVIDLRGNPGGVGMMVVPLARQLLGEDVNLGIMRMREGQQEFNVSAGTDPFKGDIAVLIDEGSASTSEIFAQSMQDIGRVKVFGATRSPGAALPSLIEELPGGAILQYVIADYQSPKGTSVEGRGVQPDTVVPEKAADFAAGHDPVLDAAVAALTQPAAG